jgi:hypothetical protein
MYRCEVCGVERFASQLAYNAELAGHVCHGGFTVAPSFKPGDDCERLARLDTKRGVTRDEVAVMRRVKRFRAERVRRP